MGTSHRDFWIFFKVCDSHISEQDSDFIRWDFENAHLENHGLVTHFDAVPIEEGKEFTFEVKWRSDSRPTYVN